MCYAIRQVDWNKEKKIIHNQQSLWSPVSLFSHWISTILNKSAFHNLRLRCWLNWPRLNLYPSSYCSSDLFSYILYFVFRYKPMNKINCHLTNSDPNGFLSTLTNELQQITNPQNLFSTRRKHQNAAWKCMSILCIFFPITLQSWG